MRKRIHVSYEEEDVRLGVSAQGFLSTPHSVHKFCYDDDDVFFLFSLETKNRSQAPYIPLGRYVP